MTERSIGVAISGGGHRAALFGLGALMYLADSGANHEVTSIASVSGGSLTNGFCAQETDFRTTTGPEFDEAMKPLAYRIAQRGTVLAYGGTWIYLLVLLIAVGGLILIWFAPWMLWVRILVFVVGLMAAAWWATLRSRVCEMAFRAQFYSKDGKSTALDSINTSIDHVFCVTDLHAGEHVYFSGRFVCAYRFGWGSPGTTPLSFAVQASAALPGVFAPRWPPTSNYAFEQEQDPKAKDASRMTLVDGGVYDNMADQWTQRVPVRNRRWHSLKPMLKEPTEAVIVNASAGMTFGSTSALGLPILGELLALKRDEEVLYDNGASLRRQMLVDRFSRDVQSGGDLAGGLVHIADSPFVVPDAFKETDGPRQDRALAALARLGDTKESRDAWESVADKSPGVKTTLSKLGTEVAADLMYHAYVLAMVNLHVVLGYPLLDVPARSRFVGMVS